MQQLLCSRSYHFLNLNHQVALEKLKLEQVNFKFSDSPSRTVVFLNTFEFVLNLTPSHYECQDVTGENENDTKKKKDVARLLKTALGVELKEKLIGSLFFMESPPPCSYDHLSGDVGKVYTEL